MRIALQLLLTALALPLLTALGGCSCGFDCNSGSDERNPALLTLGLSDSLPEDLKAVVIEVDRITFRRNTSSEVVVDSFTLANQAEVDTFKIDLLQYPGKSHLVVIDDLEMQTGSYDALEIGIVVGGTGHSYVQLQDDTVQELTVANGVLQLPGIQLRAGSQTLIVEFGLALALQAQASGSYLLTSTGVRIANPASDASLSGQIDADLFDGDATCAAKTDPTAGNRVYLYEKSTAARNVPADVYTAASARTIPATAQAPLAVASLLQNDNTQQWEYSFGYVPAGDYVLTFACDTQDDDAVDYDGITIPLPADQRYEISLSEQEQAVCNLRAGGSC